jgi:lysophospholipase L1-like esterase
LSINNYGLSGSTIAKKNSSDADAFCERYKNMTSNADIIFVMGGVNDVWFSSELGKITDTSDLTFYGAMNTLCNGLYSKYPGKQIVFITPTEEDNSSCVSSKGYVVSDFANAMRAVCSKYSIPVFDANACVGIYPYNQINSDLYTTDKLHLNDEGHKAIGDKLSRFVLNGCISNSCVIVNSGDVPQPTDPWIGKTFSATGKRYDDFYHLTLLLDADSDCFNGSKVTGHLKGSDLVNVVAGSMSGGSIFGDNSGDLTNSQYTKTYCGNVAFETVVSGGKMTINFPERVFNTNWGGESYVKIPIMIGLSTLPCSFKIDELEVYINGNKKDIIKIGGFFTDETYSIT